MNVPVSLFLSLSLFSLSLSLSFSLSLSLSHTHTHTLPLAISVFRRQKFLSLMRIHKIGGILMTSVHLLGDSGVAERSDAVVGAGGAAVGVGPAQQGEIPRAVARRA